MMYSLTRHRRVLAFTLVELLVVITIIALLVSLMQPAISSAMRRAQSVKCSSNLHSIGTAVTLAATDNNNQYPEIDQAATPVYPTGSGVLGLVGTLSNYGITSNTVQCPEDPTYFKTLGSSYEWNPVFDDEVTVTPIIYWNGGIKVPVNSGRIRLCTDFLNIHRGKMNALYGDGHVIAR